MAIDPPAPDPDEPEIGEPEADGRYPKSIGDGLRQEAAWQRRIRTTLGDGSASSGSSVSVVSGAERT